MDIIGTSRERENRAGTGSDNSSVVNFGWLIRLRWFAVVGQLATMGIVAWVLDIHLPAAAALVGVVCVTAVSNLILAFLAPDARHPGPPTAGPSGLQATIVMVLDMLSLTALLFGTGGMNNPFCLFFLVNVSLSAIVLRRNAAWSLTVLAVGCVLLLLYHHVPLEHLEVAAELHPVRSTGRFSIQQIGVLTAFAVSCGVITYFVTRISEGLRQQEFDLRQAQQRQARSDKLEALGTLAAGTAHELATPLSTIAVIARDVERVFEEHPPTDPAMAEAAADIRVLRGQLDRCKSILDRMAGRAGQTVGEIIQTLSVADLWDIVLEDLSPEVEANQLVELDIPADLGEEQLRVPVVILSQSLRGLVQNALDATTDGTPVRIRIEAYPRHWSWSIDDHGPGIPPDVLRRISEPFFSTKPVGKGMGLGVFLARNVIERLGGSIDHLPRPGGGTRVVVRMPRRDSPGAG